MRYIFCTHAEKAVPLHRNSVKWVAERAINNQKNKCMKKLLIFALCLLGICNAHAEMMTAQEIILTEIATMQPWDSEERDEKVDFKLGNRIYASIDSDQLSIDAGADEHAYAEVIDPETGVLGSSTNSLQFIVNDSVHMAISGRNIGVGVENPQETLHVNGAIRGGGANGEVTLRGDNGSVTIGATDAQTMTFNTNKSRYAFNINGTNRIAIHSNGNVGIGTPLPQQKLDVAGSIRANGLIVNGNIRAHEIVVTTTGADFVFAEEYRLRPLSEVKTFIAENKHLPEIKSAQEMQEDGVGINELQVQLLQKIEELTLYIIQQEERIAVLEMELKK